MLSLGVDIQPKDRVIVEDILKTHLPAGAAVGVFGSRVKGKARRGSDLTPQEDSALTFAFEDSNLPIRVDVVDRWGISESFWAAVEGEVTWG